MQGHTFPGLETLDSQAPRLFSGGPLEPFPPRRFLALGHFFYSGLLPFQLDIIYHLLHLSCQLEVIFLAVFLRLSSFLMA